MNYREHAVETMPRYRDWAPTGFDSKGLNADHYDIGDWFVFPVSQTRDSGPLEQSNFDSAVEMLGGESEHVQVLRFGHWGPGWFEIIIVDPNHEPTLDEAGGIICALEDYPVLDEQDFSEREYEAAQSTWENCFNERDRIEYLRRNGLNSYCDFSELRATIRGESLIAVENPSELAY